jgi:hypothetical protein
MPQPVSETRMTIRPSPSCPAPTVTCPAVVNLSALCRRFRTTVFSLPGVRLDRGDVGRDRELDRDLGRTPALRELAADLLEQRFSRRRASVARAAARPSSRFMSRKRGDHLEERERLLLRPAERVVLPGVHATPSPVSSIISR